jgi:hypothetical protein
LNRASDGRRSVGKIAGWAAISATVGLILRSLEERFGLLGDLIVGLIGVVWGAVTFFVVPVLLTSQWGRAKGSSGPPRSSGSVGANR